MTSGSVPAAYERKRRGPPLPLYTNPTRRRLVYTGLQRADSSTVQLDPGERLELDYEVDLDLVPNLRRVGDHKDSSTTEPVAAVTVELSAEEPK
jgi:hypothetical protein